MTAKTKLTPLKDPLKKEHPSIAQRKKNEAARKMRLSQILRDNLKKRKEQARSRKQSLVQEK